jgi:hypothetical protein
MSTTPKRYTRFELMDTTGRVVVHCGNTQSLEQDECRTLKVFIDQPARAAGLTVEETEQVVKEWMAEYDIDLGDGDYADLRARLTAAAAGFKPTEP